MASGDANQQLARRAGYTQYAAGAIGHPVTGKPDKVDGILFMSQFKPRPVLHENDRGICVKDWLLNEGGVGLDEMQWMFLEDIFNLTTKIEEFLEAEAQAGRLVGSQ